VQWITSAGPGQFVWNDAPAMYHGNVDTMAFADGHAESHKWNDATIIAAGLRGATGQPSSSFGGPTSGRDYEFVRFRMRFPNWK
jgi:prepilin-type processing-associated H-X9-DG protein